MALHRNDTFTTTPDSVVEVTDAKKGKKGGKSGAMAKGKAGGPADMRMVPGKETSVSAEKGNKAAKVKIPTQKLK